jgi:hypothetical protein
MDVRVVRGTKDLGLVRGATAPHFMECDDGRTYLVKFADSSRAVINDFIGHAIGRAVGLPVPNNTLVEIGQELIAGSGDLRNRGISPGLHHGSEAIPDSFDLRTIQEPGILNRELSNAGTVPGTVCLDNWILTDDRDRPENHLLQAGTSGFRYFMVDFTHSFTGPRWTADTLDQGTFLRVMVPILPGIAECVRDSSSFQPTLEKIESTTDSEIEEVVDAVPTRWGMTDEERLCMVNFLELRRGLVRTILYGNKVVFPNWVA